MVLSNRVLARLARILKINYITVESDGSVFQDNRLVGVVDDSGNVFKLDDGRVDLTKKDKKRYFFIIRGEDKFRLVGATDRDQNDKIVEAFDVNVNSR